MTFTKTEYLCFLNTLFYDQAKRMTEIYKHYPSHDAFNAGISTAELSPTIQKRQASFSPDRFQENCAKNDIKIITIMDADYPSLLKEIANPPLVLYYKGDQKLFNDPCIAIVGPRKCSPYGKEVAKKMTEGLVGSFRIVSGLARGIDTIAHLATLKYDHPPIAVIGSGLDVIYPYENKDLFKKVAESGLLVSEFPLHTSPKPHHFPQRNRIISGLSKGVLVCEAGLKSGSLLTAQMALEQNRDVFTCPGSIFSDYSKGPHQLIKDGAILVQSPQDILNELSPQLDLFSFASATEKNSPPSHDLSEEEQELLAHIAPCPISLESLLSVSKKAVHEVLQVLSLLESKGIITQSRNHYSVCSHPSDCTIQV